MKKLALCVMVLCLLALSGISQAQSPVPPVPVLPNLTGHWNLQLTGVDPSGNVKTTTGVIMTLTQAPKNPAFYSGTITGDAEGTSITLVQEGADVNFTISSGSKTTLWGTGLAGMKKIELLWRDAEGNTGVGSAVPVK